jgi:hypothetical protein
MSGTVVKHRVEYLPFRSSLAPISIFGASAEDEVCVGSDTATLSPPTLRNDAKFADTVYMADSYLFDIPTKAGDDLGFPGSGQAAMLQTMPATLISGGGRSLVRYNRQTSCSTNRFRR